MTSEPKPTPSVTVAGVDLDGPEEARFLRVAMQDAINLIVALKDQRARLVLERALEAIAARASRPTPEAEVEAVARLIMNGLEGACGYKLIDYIPTARAILALQSTREPTIEFGPSDRLAAIPNNLGSYAEAVLSVYQHRPEGEFYRDLNAVLSQRPQEDQGSSRADIPLSEDDTPTPSPAGGEG